MADLITSLRMYSVGAGIRDAWRALFGRIFADVGLDVRFIEHRFPQPIDALWKTPGLCADFMCGWPFIRSNRGMQPIAAPIPAPSRYAGLARYCSEFLVRDDSGWTSLEQTFGHRIGWMATDSQSGFNAPRALLAGYTTASKGNLFGQSNGPYVTPPRLLDALRRGEVDVIAVDGFYLDLCRRSESARVAELRSIAVTPWTAIPLVVAAADVAPGIVERLRAQFLRVGSVPEYAPLLGDVLLEGFALPSLDLYDELEEMSQRAMEQGYESIR